MPKGKPRQISKRMIGQYIVADPAICHGQPTFRGTRILVADVMEQLAGGVAQEAIFEAWRGDICLGAISETIELGLTVPIALHSGKRLATFGGTQPKLRKTPRRRSAR